MNTDTLPDLWPDDLDPPADIATPATILRAQGEALGRRTGNVVYGEVESEQDGTGPSHTRPNRFVHRFHLVSGYLNFSRQLLYVTHGVNPYPAGVITVSPTEDGTQLHKYSVTTPTELENVLRMTFARDEVKELIRSLRAQALDPDE
jgi:hypothetical protein